MIWKKYIYIWVMNEEGINAWDMNEVLMKFGWGMYEVCIMFEWGINKVRMMKVKVWMRYEMNEEWMRGMDERESRSGRY